MEEFRSDWKPLSSLREAYDDMVDHVRRLGLDENRTISFENFVKAHEQISGNEVPVNYSDYDVSVTEEGTVKERYGDSVQEHDLNRK